MRADSVSGALADQLVKKFATECVLTLLLFFCVLGGYVSCRGVSLALPRTHCPLRKLKPCHNPHSLLVLLLCLVLHGHLAPRDSPAAEERIRAEVRVG